MKLALIRLLIFIPLLTTGLIYAHGNKPTAHYLANEAVMVEDGDIKILFDPFFHNDYGHYTLVPEPMRQSIFNNEPPFNNIEAVFISHAHGDHFDGDDVLKYLTIYKNIKLFAPQQAVSMLEKLDGYKVIKDRVFPFVLTNSEIPEVMSVKHLNIEAVSIPHAGWPETTVDNLLFRVSLNNKTIVMHFGDADVNTQHFDKYKQFWSKRKTNIALPPYWFFMMEQGQQILNNIIKADQVIGIHVPTKVPEDLKTTGFDYYSKPGETREIN